MHISAREHYNLALARNQQGHEIGRQGEDLTAVYERRLAQMSNDRHDEVGTARHIREVRRRTFDLG